MLDEPGEDDHVTQTEGISPYSLYGDSGEKAINGAPLRVGRYTLSATAWAGSGGTGTVLDTLSVSFTVEAAQETAPPLTATFPASAYASAQHQGPGDHPQVVVAFSAPVAAFGADTPSASATGASVESVQRFDKEGLENAYLFFLTPEGHEAIVFRLHANRACTDGGICTAAGGRLSTAPSATIGGPVGIAVANARVDEGADAVLAFAVTLSRAASRVVTVDYATADGSAHAGDDYTAARSGAAIRWRGSGRQARDRATASTPSSAMRCRSGVGWWGPRGSASRLPSTGAATGWATAWLSCRVAP